MRVLKPLIVIILFVGIVAALFDFASPEQSDESPPSDSSANAEQTDTILAQPTAPQDGKAAIAEQVRQNIMQPCYRGACAIGHMPDSTPDPYAAGQRAEQDNAYFAMKEEALDRIAVEAWAFKCQVVSNVDVFNLKILETHALLAPTGGVNMRDRNLEQDITNAQKIGAAYVSQNGCSFWKNNPSEVADLRARAQLAAY